MEGGHRRGWWGERERTNQFLAMMPLPMGFSAFLRRLGILTLERDERALRFWSSRPIACGVVQGLLVLGSGGIGVETTSTSTRCGGLRCQNFPSRY